MAKPRKKIILEVDESELAGEKEKKDTIRVLCFSLGTENYCIYVSEAKEIARPGRITRVPNTPGFITGVMNLRGEIIPLVDIRYFFGLEEPEKKETMVIITDVTGSPMGILVDKISGTRDIDKPLIQPPLATVKGALAECTRGQIQVDNEILTLLNLEKIMRSKEIEILKR
jgi:purine-binding chemotaxis protein CheW